MLSVYSICWSGSSVYGLGFRVNGSGARIEGLGLRVQGAGCRVCDEWSVRSVTENCSCFGSRIQNSIKSQRFGFKVHHFGFRVHNWTQDSIFRIQGSECLRLRVQNPIEPLTPFGFRVQGFRTAKAHTRDQLKKHSHGSERTAIERFGTQKDTAAPESGPGVQTNNQNR